MKSASPYRFSGAPGLPRTLPPLNGYYSWKCDMELLAFFLSKLPQLPFCWARGGTSQRPSLVEEGFHQYIWHSVRINMAWCPCNFWKARLVSTSSSQIMAFILCIPFYPRVTNILEVNFAIWPPSKIRIDDISWIFHCLHILESLALPCSLSSLYSQISSYIHLPLWIVCPSQINNNVVCETTHSMGDMLWHGITKVPTDSQTTSMVNGRWFIVRWISQLALIQANTLLLTNQDQLPSLLLD